MRKFLPFVLLLLGAALIFLMMDGGPAGKSDPVEETQESVEIDLDPAPVNVVSEERSSAIPLEEPYNNRQVKVGAGKYGLFGKVIDEDGQAVANAWVAAYSVPFPLIDFEFNFAEILEKPLNFELEPLASVFTDDKGEFQLQGVPGRNLYLTARSLHRLTPRRQRVVVDALDREEGVVLKTVAAASLRGRVVDATGAAVANSEVLVGPGVKYLVSAIRNRTFFFERIFTDAQGEFYIEAVPANMTLTSNAFYQSVQTGLTEFGPLRANTEGQTLVKLDEMGSLTGKVHDTEEEPVGSAIVVAVPLDLRKIIPFVRDPNAWTTTSKSNGSYAFNLLPNGNYVMLAQGDKGRSGPSQSYVSGPNSVAKVIQVDTKAIIEGRVVDTQGKPLGGATVSLQSIPEGDLGDEEARLRSVGGFYLEAAREILPELLPLETKVRTDSQGRFRLPAWRRARLRVSAPGFVDNDFKLSGLKKENPVLVMYQPGSVEGLVVDSNAGKPVQFYLIRGELRSLEGAKARREKEEAARSAREAELELAMAATGEASEDEVNGEDLEVEEKTPLQQSLSEDEQAIFPSRSWRANVYASYFCDDPSGRFRLDNLPPGEWRLIVRANNYAVEKGTNIEIKAGEVTKGVIVNLNAGATVYGQVVKKGTEEPIAGAVVSAGRGEESGFAALLQGLDDDTAMTETNSEGRFVLQGVREKSDWIHVLAGGFAAASLKIEPLESFEERKDVTVEVLVGGTIEGIVTDRHGIPVAGRMVGAMSPQAKDLQQTSTDSEGFYRMENMRPGSYFMLTASLDDESLFTGDLMSIMNSSRLTTAWVSNGEVSKVDIVDPSAGGVKLTGTLSQKGMNVQGAFIMATANEKASLLDFRMASSRTNENGEFEFKSLAPGEYTLNIDAPDWEGQLIVDIPDIPEHFVYLEVPRGEVHGRVLAEVTGEPVKDATVMLVRDDVDTGAFGMFGPGGGSRDWGETDEQGYFSFEGVAPGEYHVEVRGSSWWRGSDEEENRPKLGVVESEAFVLNENEIHQMEPLALPVAGDVNVLTLDSAGNKYEGRFSLVAKPQAETEQPEEEDWFRNRGWGRRGKGVIRNLSPGMYDIEVTADGYSPRTIKDVEVRQGETTEVQVTMVKGVKLRARVLGSDNRPLANAQMDVYNLEGEKVSKDSGIEAAVARFFGGNSDGAVEVGTFDPGSYYLKVTWEDQVREVPVNLIEDQSDVVEVRF